MSCHVQCMNTSLKERALINILPRKRDFARRKSLLPDGRNGLPWDAESQTYLPVAANSPYVPPPSLVCLHSSSRLLDLDAHFPFYLLDLDALFPLLPSP